MKDYYIVGDNEYGKECLVVPCGKDEKFAEQKLKRMLEDPTENEKRWMGNLKNIRIASDDSEKCWWNDPGLVK